MHFLPTLRRSILTSAVILCIPVLLQGCGKPSGLFAYTEGAAEFTMILPSVSGDTDEIRAACTRDGTGNFTLTVTHPPRLNGFTVTYRDSIPSAGHSGMMIPLSDSTAENLVTVFTALSSPGSPQKSPDGKATVIHTDSADVTLDETLTPAAAATEHMTVRIENWKCGGQ